MNTHGLDEITETEYRLLTQLREKLELNTVMPYTILTFAIARINRLENELERALWSPDGELQ